MSLFSVIVIVVTHSWKAFYTASTGLSKFPQFVAVNIVDDEPVGYFDSRTSSFQYRQKWIEENLGPEYLKQQTNVLKGTMARFKTIVGILMESFNQSGGKQHQQGVTLFSTVSFTQDLRTEVSV